MIVGQLCSVDDAIAYFTRVMEAEKIMGPLTREEKLVILSTLGTPLEAEELASLLEGKRVLHIKEDSNGKH